jgi:hypothetical protein
MKNKIRDSFHPLRYLRPGRTEWAVMWCNLDQQPDPRAWLEDRLGPLLGFEPILDVAPKTMLQLWQHMQAVRAKQRSNVVSITATPENRSHSCRA